LIFKLPNLVLVNPSLINRNFFSFQGFPTSLSPLISLKAAPGFIRTVNFSHPQSLSQPVFNPLLVSHTQKSMSITFFLSVGGPQVRSESFLCLVLSQMNLILLAFLSHLILLHFGKKNSSFVTFANGLRYKKKWL